MYAFIMHVLIVLPPLMGHGKPTLHKFQIQSTPVYQDVEQCSNAVDKTGAYIERKLPKAAVKFEADCFILELVES